MEQQDEMLDSNTVEPTPQDAQEEEMAAASPTTMEALLAQEEINLELPQAGEVREGVIISLTESEALVSIGAKSEGIIPSRELAQLSDEERDELTVGSEVTVYVVTPEDSNGNLILSYSRAVEETDWLEAERVKETNEIFEGKIIGFNKGGLLVQFGRLRGFVPASQISPSRRAVLGTGTPDQRWGKMVDEKIITRAIEVDRQRRRLILSELAALQEAREIYKERLLDNIQIGDEMRGRVTSLAQFGAFVNINGADGLVHLTEVSWDRIRHPGDVLKVGQEVDVRVISIDRDNKRIGLSIRQMLDDPWPKRVSEFTEGQLIEGSIVRLTKFGAFARIADDLEGLIHISELSDHRIEHPKEVVKEGEVLTLRIINIDVNQRRIGLSLRKVHSPAFADLDMQMAMDDFVQVDDAVETEAEEEPEIEVPAAEEPEIEVPAAEEETVEDQVNA